MIDSSQEILEILKANNILLREIKGLLLTILSDNDYSQSQDMRAFNINVAADIFVSLLTDDEKRKLRNNFLRNGTN